MSVKVYYSTDESAPTLSGTAGYLISVLDACLVNGYGSKSGAGWTKAFSGTNLASYLQGAGSNGRYLYVDDTGTTTARVIGYETMSGVSTGTNPFPISAQLSGGCYVYKSSVASTVARAWCLVATPSAFYLYIGDSEAALAAAAFSPRSTYFFGDFTSFKTGDVYNTALIANSAASNSGNSFATISALIASATPGHFCNRSHTQTGQSVTLGKSSHSLSDISGSVTSASYPDPVSGGILMAPMFLSEASAAVLRGKLPGAYALFHSFPGQCGDTFQGAGDLAGKSFILLNASANGSAGRVAIEISDTW